MVYFDYTVSYCTCVVLLILIMYTGYNLYTSNSNITHKIKIDMDIIAQIESNNNILAYNKISRATGKYQITFICLKDFNNYHKQKYKLIEMFNEDKAFIVANWYMQKRIPQLLKYYKIKDTLENRLICYNAGIGKLIKGIIPQETKDYIKKYKKEQI